MLTKTNRLLIKLPFTSPVLRSNIHTTLCLSEIQKLTRLRVVDNSVIGKQAMAEGKPPRCIHVYNKTGIGKIGMVPSLFMRFRNLQLIIPR